MQPPPKPKRTLGPAMRPPAAKPAAGASKAPLSGKLVSRAAAQVEADLALLSSASRRAQEGSAAEEGLAEQEQQAAATWAPPKGQSGDGRTSLNDKFGY